MAQAMTPLKKLKEALAQDRTRRDARGARSRRQRGSVTIAKAPARVCASSTRTVSARRGKNRDSAESGPPGSAATTSSDISSSSETSDSESSDDSSTTDDDTWGLATRVARGAAPRRRQLNDGELQACHICGKTFLLKSSVRRHIKTKHTDEWLRPHYVCESRDLVTSAARGPAPRRRERNDGELQACHICGKTFRLTSSVRRHMRIKHTDEFLRQHYICESRDLDDSGAPATVLRRKLKGEGPHVCHVCEKSFARRSCVRRHMMTKHMGERPYQCPICQRRFAQKVSLTRHQQTHAGEKLHECPECGGKFASERYLRSHQLTHTGAMPYECRLCPAAFARKDTLNCHLRTHTGERPYECDACGARFSDKAALRRHRLIHVRQPVASDHPRSSGTSSPLISPQEDDDDDEQTHENEQYPYHCRPCGRNFVRKETLASHIEQHAGGQLHACRDCPATFAHKSHLDRHKLQHSGRKPYECNVCGIKFTRSWARSRHLRKVCGAREETATRNEVTGETSTSGCQALAASESDGKTGSGLDLLHCEVAVKASPSSCQTPPPSEGEEETCSLVDPLRCEVAGQASPSGRQMLSPSEGNEIQVQDMVRYINL